MVVREFMILSLFQSQVFLSVVPILEPNNHENTHSSYSLPWNLSLQIRQRLI